MSSQSPPSEEGIAIIGFPRSGTTLLRRLLDAHSNIACPGETYLLSACARFLYRQRMLDGLHTGVVNGLSFAGFETQEVLDRLREFAFSFHREHAARQGKRRWAEKTAVDAFHLPAIENAFGDHLRMVLVVRHGLDVCLSCHDLCSTIETYPAELHDYAKQYMRPLEAFAHAWVDVCRTITEVNARSPEQTLVVRYEDLVQSPEEQLRRVLEFLGEPWEAGLVERGLMAQESPGLGDWKSFSTSGIETGSVGRYRQLSQTTRSELAAIMNPTLESFGYPPEPVAETVSDEEARRRYELRIQVQSLRRPGEAG